MGTSNILRNRLFSRGKAGEHLVYKHHDVFILGQLESSGYEPVLNVSIMPWSTKNLAPSVWHKACLYATSARNAETLKDMFTMSRGKGTRDIFT